MNKKLQALLMLGVVRAGSYDPDVVIHHIEESLTMREAREAQSFLAWVHESHDQRSFGYGNIVRRYHEFKESTKKGAIKQ